ncbi:MAG: BrnA antitoxin family protein [Neisseriaceae bacterium]|nr:BrnA antitoxin family protein [Neisseriaceae bacterium]
MKTINKIDAMDEEDIEYYQNANLPNDEWLPVEKVPFIKAYQGRKDIRRMYAPRKKSVTLRLDEDIIAFFKKDGRGYQTRLNAILRQAMYDQLQA